MGRPGKHVAVAELDSLPVVRRGVYASRNLAAGARLTAADVLYLRPRAGLSPAEIDRRFGMPLAKPVRAGEPLTTEHFS
jgi:sialic acid synthase SpsE